MEKNLNFVICIETSSQSTSKHMLFTKILQKMLKQDLILQIMNQIDDYLEEKIKR